jgi:hypothetical protein
MDTDYGARVCDPQQFENQNRRVTAAAHKAALRVRFLSGLIRVHPWFQNEF